MRGCAAGTHASQGTSQHQTENSRPRYQGERQRPLTNNISSFNLFFRLGRWQPQRVELLEAMAVVAEALSGLHHSRKFTKQSLVSKQALLARGLALDYCAGPGGSGNQDLSVPRRHGIGLLSVQATKPAMQPGKGTHL